MEPPEVPEWYVAHLRTAQGRISIVRGRAAKAIEYHRKAAAAQQQYRNLHLISYWEIAVAGSVLRDIQESLECWVILKAEATVSQFRSRMGWPANIFAVVKSDLRFRHGNLHAASLWEKEKGRDS